MDDRARSLYWQLRVTVSWSEDGSAVWSLSGKQQNDRWQDMRMIDSGRGLLAHVPEGTIMEGLELLERLLRSDILPRRLGPP